MEPQVTDLPFKLSARTIAILKDLPVLQCNQCGEYVIEDPIMEKVDLLLKKVDTTLALEIVGFSATECSEDQLYEKVEKSVRTFFKKDRNLLDIDVHEGSIAHKVAEYLQYEFPDMNVDCEYNRQGDSGKVKKSLNTDQAIRPDIIVHKRGTKYNCLVIEIKKSGSQIKDIKNDHTKLKELTDPNTHGYKVGLFLEIDIGSKRISEALCFKGGKNVNQTMWDNLKSLVDPFLPSDQLSGL